MARPQTAAAFKVALAVGLEMPPTAPVVKRERAHAVEVAAAAAFAGDEFATVASWTWNAVVQIRLPLVPPEEMVVMATLDRVHRRA